MTTSSSRRSSRRGRVLFALFGVLAAIVCVRLGFWQLGRHADVRADRAEREERLAEPTVQLAALLDSASARKDEESGVEWRRVSLSGRWRPDGEVVVRSRTLSGRPGVHVVTPFVVDARPEDPLILVLRGWLPSADAMTIDSVAAPASGSLVSRTGVLRASRDGAGLPALPAGMGTSRRTTFAAIDVPAIREAGTMGEGGPITARYYVQLLPDGDVERVAGRPVPVPLPGADDGPHLGYAIQWFSFALIAVLGSGAFLYHGRRQDSAA